MAGGKKGVVLVSEIKDRSKKADAPKKAVTRKPVAKKAKKVVFIPAKKGAPTLVNTLAAMLLNHDNEGRKALRAATIDHINNGAIDASAHDDPYQFITDELDIVDEGDE